MFLAVAGHHWLKNVPSVDGQGRHSLTVKGGGARGVGSLGVRRT